MTNAPSSSPSAGRRRSWRRSVAAVVCLVAAVGSAALWWRATHVDDNGQIPQPTLAVKAPYVLLQAAGLRNGLHCVGMTGNPQSSFSVHLERQTHLHEPGYARAGGVAFAGFRFVVLTRTLGDTDSILSPFVAVVLPYWFLVVC